MTPEERIAEIINSHEESNDGRRLAEKIAAIVREAVAEERELCARAVENGFRYRAIPGTYTVESVTTPEELAAAIRDRP